MLPLYQADNRLIQKIAAKLIDIYQRTGRVIADATAQKNFLTTLSGEVVCVDIGMALQLDLQQRVVFSEAPKRERRGSLASQNAWDRLKEYYHETFFRHYSQYFPETTKTVQRPALFTNTPP